MGIVLKQSFKNTLTTYWGFAFGALNTLFLYTNFLSESYYGLITFILSTANIMMPLMAVGVHNTLVKFYSGYAKEIEKDRFLTYMVFLPFIFIIPLGLIGWIAYDAIAAWLSRENAIVGNYVALIFITAIAMAYFEIFYAWARVQFKSVYGNFLKEVFHRICITLLLFGVFLEWLTVQEFIYALVGVYILRMVLMKLYAYTLRPPKLTWKRPNNLPTVLNYSFLIILAGSVAVLILDIDKFMIGQYLPIEQVAFYGVAVYIATVIAVPARAMHQITYPLTAQLLNSGARAELKNLYRKSSINLFIVGGGIFLLIVLNLHEMYLLISEAYRGAVLVVFLIGAAKLYDNLLGNNNAILFSSDHYPIILVLGLLLVFLIVSLNMIFIPILGINGAAIATFLAIVIYNTAKLIFVKNKLRMHPFTHATWKTLGIITLLFLLFYFWNFPFHPIINITLKSILVIAVYLWMIYTFRLSDDMVRVIQNLVKRKTR